MAAPKSHNLFQVYLRLRPVQKTSTEAFIAVEDAQQDHTSPTHITLKPPNDRRRAIEKFAFTQVFEEDATQLDVFHCTNVVSLVEGVLAPHGGDGTDALLATLGVTGSGKVRGSRHGIERLERLSLTMADAYHTRVSNPEGHDAARARRHISISWTRRPRLRLARQPGRFTGCFGYFGSDLFLGLDLPGKRLCGCLSTVEGELQSTDSHDCTVPRSFC